MCCIFSVQLWISHILQRGDDSWENAVLSSDDILGLNLCSFHVIKYLKQKVSSEQISTTEKSEIMICIKKLIYARSEHDFNNIVHDLETLSPKSFYDYFLKNWMNCKNLWAHFARRHLPTFGNNTNNRIESHNQKLKQYIRPQAHLDEAITELVNYIQSVEDSIKKAQFQDLKSFVNTKTTDPIHLDIANVCTRISYDHVCKELQKSSKCTQLSFRANNDLYIVKSDDQEYRLESELTQCSNLPCRHIFALREKMDMPIFEYKLIPKRWQKNYSQKIFSTSNSIKYKIRVQSKKDSKKTLMTVNQKFNKAMVVMKQIADHIANCGQTEFEFKLSKLENVLTSWQKKQTFLSDTSLTDSSFNATQQDVCQFKGPTNILDEYSVEHLDSTSDVTDSAIIISQSDKPLKSDIKPNSSSSPFNSSIESDSVAIDPRRSFPNIQLTTNGKIQHSPITNLASKLKLNKIERRRGRPKGTKKSFMDFSKKDNTKTLKRKRQNFKTRENKKKLCSYSKVSSSSDEEFEMPSFEETLYGEITSSSETKPKSISQKSNTQPKAKLSSIIGRSTRASYWVESLSLKEVDKNVLDSDVAWLNDKHIMAAQTLIRTQFSEINGLQNPLLAQQKAFDICRKNMIQILHCGNYKHWLTITTVNAPDNTVYVYNSIDEKLQQSVIQQICSIVFCQAKSLKIISKPCQLQKGINDCGVFAIATALSIASGMDPSKLNYNQELMRNHLKSCFENKYLKMFPCLKDVVNKTVKKIENINLICEWRQPNYKSSHFNYPHGPTIQCSSCEKIFHKFCVSNKSTNYFVCSACS